MKFISILSAVILILFFQVSTFTQSENGKKFLTKFEKSGFMETAKYYESIEYFKMLEKSSSYARMITIGVTPQGRNIHCFIAAKGKEFSPEKSKKSGKAIVLIENGIHAGEIEGKDASMMLLREILITKEKQSLLDNVILLVIPVLNADGHERRSEYNRINQNGPRETGWRTTAQNLNLNRDFLKADAPEMQALLKLFSTWLPDFFIDCHTTDGSDFQYTVLYAFEKFGNIYEKTANWLKDEFEPFMTGETEKEGYLCMPYANFSGDALEKGLYEWVSSPRLSTGYAAAQNRPSLLIETHSLKPYKERVFATKAVLTASLNKINRDYKILKQLNKEADESAVKEFVNDKKPFPVAFKNSGDSVMFRYKGIKAKKDSSYITGSKVTRYTGEYFETDAPYYNKMSASDFVTAPDAYVIPAEYKEIAERLKLHGVLIKEVKKDTETEVTKTRFRNVSFSLRPNEGRHQVNFDAEYFKDKIVIQKGSYIVPTNQRAVKVILFLLEAKSEESFLKWGFFNSIFEQKEYFEEYSMEPIAQDMLNNNSKLKEEFEEKLKSDDKFRNSPYQRLFFFYERSPYYDNNMNVYPIIRVDGL